MGKRKWQRVRLVELADEQTQNQVLDLIDRANQQPGESFPENRASEMPQVERKEVTPALTPG
jgi:hypothetical protein